MNIAAKYGKSYFMPPEVTYDWVKKDSIEKSPFFLYHLLSSILAYNPAFHIFFFL